MIGVGYELTADGKDISAIYYLDPDTHVQDPTYELEETDTRGVISSHGYMR